MLHKLVNEVQLRVQLSTDMRIVRCMYNGQEMVYIPGSSIREIFRSFYEQRMIKAGGQVCDALDTSTSEFSRSCAGRIAYARLRHCVSEAESYAASCMVCRLFGSRELNSRIQFTDAYPVGEVMNLKSFECKITLTNFARYQLAVILAILENIDHTVIPDATHSGQGNCSMKFVNRLELPMVYHYYGNELTQFRGYAPTDLGKSIKPQRRMLFQEYIGLGIAEIKDIVDVDTVTLETLPKAIAQEK